VRDRGQLHETGDVVDKAAATQKQDIRWIVSDAVAKQCQLAVSHFVWFNLQFVRHIDLLQLLRIQLDHASCQGLFARRACFLERQVVLQLDEALRVNQPRQRGD
jgi:hypothetical protein